MGSRHASPKETIEVGALLERFWDKEKKCYRDGYSDAAIARMLGGNVTVNVVQRVRSSLGYKMVPAAGGFGTFTARLEALERCFADLEKRVAELERRYPPNILKMG